MKKATYLSIFTGVLFLAISLIGFFLDQNYHTLLLPLGIGILLLISLPLFLMQLNDRSKKNQNNLKQRQHSKNSKKDSVNKPGKKNATNYPSFSNRKSGLTWGGGNIHASTAKRGSKKRFLER